MKPSDREAHDKICLELRRGVLTLAVLAALREEHYGYSLRRALQAAGLEIDEGTLYPLVRRLEGQDLLVSDWRTAEGRERRYYRLSAAGKRVLGALETEWNTMNTTLAQLLDSNS